MAAALFRRSDAKRRLPSEDGASSKYSNNSQGHVVLLTGSTGNFGAYVLDDLLAQAWVTQVICLNRSENARERQLQVHQERGLTTGLERVIFYQAEYSHARLGLSSEAFETLLSSVDLVIHNAWRVDFNLNFRSFQPSIAGVQNLIDFCQAGVPNHIRILFVSSVGATSNFASAAPTSRVKIPEAELKDFKVARTGYGQSKLVSERLLAHAARETGLPATIVRIGQLAGPVQRSQSHGKWPEKEWLPSIVRSSMTLGALPGDLGPIDDVDWVPADAGATILVELSKHCVEITAKAGKQAEASFFHIVNPGVVSWSTLTQSIQEHANKTLDLVPFVEWMAMLKQSRSLASSLESIEANPAIKLLDFLDHLHDRAVRFPKSKATLLETKRTEKVSKTLASLRTVNPQWMALWMEQWAWTVS